MKLYSEEGMAEGPGLCCRQSRLRWAIGGLFLCAFVAGGGILARHAGAPRWVWVAWTVVATLGVAIILRGLLARFRPTNWVLRVQPDGLWMNLRPLQGRPAAGAATVFHLSYAEVTRAHRHIDTWSTPSTEGGSTDWKQESLELHLASGDTRELARALAEARASDKSAPVSVTLPAPNVVRIAWWGLGHDVAPGLGRVLAELNSRVAVADTTRTDRPDWRQLTDAELDQQVEQLVRWGDPLGASELLMRRRGCSATEAHKLVGELSIRV